MHVKVFKPAAREHADCKASVGDLLERIFELPSLLLPPPLPARAKRGRMSQGAKGKEMASRH